MRCYGTNLDYWNEEEQDYDGEDYITVVTEGNFNMILDCKFCKSGQKDIIGRKCQGCINRNKFELI